MGLRLMIGVGATLAMALVASAQEEVAPIAVEANWDTASFVPRRAPIAVELSRELLPGEGRIAILVDTVDLSDLFWRSGSRLVYRPEVLPLTAGEGELVLYVVSPENDWQERARVPLKVLERGGFERLESSPRADLSLRSEVEIGGSDAAPSSIPEAGNVQFDFRFSAGRARSRYGFSINVVGVTEVEEALRFFDEGESAPRVDLSSYLIEVEQGKTRLALGGVGFGDSRHLIQHFSSRGLSVSAPLGRWVEVGAAALNGTSIVGWDNAVGLEDSGHRVLSGSLALNLLAPSPGDLRLELTYLDGRLRPLDNFGQGSVNDREENEGWSLRLDAATPAQRFRLEGGYAVSDFTNPADPFLAQGAELVAVEAEEREARFLDLELGLIEGAKLSERFQAGVRLGVHHERVEPQYRTVAAFAQADIERNAADLGVDLGPLSLQLSWSESEDNLDEIPSILTTGTEQRGLNLALPLGQLLREPHPALPALNYAFGRTHQFGMNVPVDGGFNPSHLPDQVSLSHTAGLQWTVGRWSVSYDLSFSDQDNRQPGREAADFETLAQGLRLGVTPHPKLDLGLDVSWERGENLELEEIRRTRRYGMSLAWRILETLHWSGQYSLTEGKVERFRSLDESSILNMELVWRFQRSFSKSLGSNGQLFLRYALQELLLVDPRFGLNQDGDAWRLTAGLSLSLHRSTG